MESVPVFVRIDFKKWRMDEGNGKKVAKFLSLAHDGTSVDGKTLIQMAADPNTPNDDKAILNEYMAW
jgi:hypothetical protein